jgi:hypothetical protein
MTSLPPAVAENQLTEYNRTSLFNKPITERNEDEEKEIEPSLPYTSRTLFSFGVITIKLFLPAFMAACFTGMFYFWKDLIFHVGPYYIDSDAQPAWLSILLPLTYITGIILVGILLAALASIGLFNFRSGLMDYFSIGFFHWYIFTDILYGWVQMYMSPLSGTGLYMWWMRLMGADIGNESYVDIPGGLREVNNIIMKERSVLLTRFIYAHYIDHGKLQFAPVVIGSEVCINKECMIMPLTTYEDNTTLRPYSSTIKGQVFTTNRIFQGHPAVKAFDSKLESVDDTVYTPMQDTKDY